MIRHACWKARKVVKFDAQKSLNITGYLEHLLLKYPLDCPPEDKPFTLITPSNPEGRGAQLSLRLQPGLLDHVLHYLEEKGVVIDERKPDVVRVAPAPLYNTYTEVWEFCQIFLHACREAVKARKWDMHGLVILFRAKEYCINFGIKILFECWNPQMDIWNWF